MALLAAVAAAAGCGGSAHEAAPPTSWRLVATPPLGGTALFDGVSCVSPSFCLAVGSRLRRLVSHTLVERWDGSRWSVVPTSDPADEHSNLRGVSCASPSFCVAVGSHFTATGAHALIESWTVLPDFCSVNFAEPGTEELGDLLLNKGIAVEAGLSSIADARIFVASPLRDRCLRVLIEIEPGGPDDPVKTAAAIIRILDAGGVHLPRLQHGLGTCAWPILRDALARGYDVRIGLEDTLTLRDNSRAAGNADLVASVAELAISSKSAV